MTGKISLLLGDKEATMDVIGQVRMTVEDAMKSDVPMFEIDVIPADDQGRLLFAVVDPSTIEFKDIQTEGKDDE